MRTQRRTWQASVLSLVLLGLSGMWFSVALGDEKDARIEATVLWFEEQEPGTDIYPVRMLVTADHLRIDDGHDDGDFVLLDRITRAIFTVSHVERNIMEFTHRAANADVPEGIGLTEELPADPDAPAIDGKRPRHLRLIANSTVCYEAVVVPGLLPAAAGALAEYARTLGDRQLNSLENLPPEIKTPCFLSRYAYAPDAWYRPGLPIQEWDGAGYRRALVKFTAAETVSPMLFEIPPSYQVFRPGG